MNKIHDPNLFKSIKAFLTVYLPKIKEKSPHTVQSYKDTLNLFIRFQSDINKLQLHRITSSLFNAESIMTFLEWLKTDRGNSDSTVNQRLKCMRRFCRYIAGENILEFETYSRIQEIDKKPVSDRVLEDNLSTDEIKHLLDLPDSSEKISLRDRFYMALLYDTGCRNSEILGLKFGDVRINKDSGHVNINNAKGAKFRVTPLSQEIIAMFEQYVNVFHPDKVSDKYLFYIERKNMVTQMSPDNTARILSKYEQQAKKQFPKMVHLHPHLFRHARALHLYKAGMPLPLVCEWLGHSRMETTLIYAYADAEMKRIVSEKITNAENTVFTNEAFKYCGDETAIRKLYGLA